MLRKLAVLALLSMLVALVPAPSAGAQTDPVFTITGSGWGHGVGMSQYGARAMARSGFDAEQILTTYYTGVTLRDIGEVLPGSHWLRSDPAPLWIGIAQDQSSLGFSVTNGSAEVCLTLEAGGPCIGMTATTGENWELRSLGGGICQFFEGGAPAGNPGSCFGEITWGNQPNTRIDLAGHFEYARGTIKIRPADGGFHVVLQIGIDEYLYGLGEMPSDWDAEALQAQAIAARTYGLRQALRWGAEPALSTSRRAQCWCQLFDSTVDQAYVGWLKENEPVDAAWVAAVDATSGELVTHPLAPESTVIIAYYSSSSGGHTDNNVDGFGHSDPLPYLVAIDDPWSVDPLAENPLASWSKSVNASTIAASVGLDTVTGISIAERNPSGSVARVTVSGTDGGSPTSVSRSGRSIKSALGLRSSFFSIGGSAGPPPPSPTAGLCEDPAPPQAGFADVSHGNVHRGDIDCVAHLGVIPGLTSSSFDPTGEIPRRHMALFMARSAELMGIEMPEPSDQGFDDLGGLTQEERDAVNRLGMLGVTIGTGPGTFSPDRTIDRWQMAIFLIRLHRLVGFDVPAVPAGFVDMGGHPQETVQSVNQLFSIGVTKGCWVNPARYCPDRQVTRQEMASFLARLIRLDT